MQRAATTEAVPLATFERHSGMAYRLSANGKLDRVELSCSGPGPGQILLRMHAASLNYRDLLVFQGRYPRAQQSDIVPLSDGAGEVVACGPGVTRFAPGDRVAPIFFQSWLCGEMTPGDSETALGGSIDGVLAEYRLFDAEAVVMIPPHLDFEQAATLPCAALTAWNGLYGQRPLTSGDTVLTLGTGGVSTFALQFAHAAGARVIVTSSSDDKLDVARSLGASETINYRRTADWSKEVRRLTDGRGVDHVIETAGGATMPQSIAATRRGGIVHLIGVIAPGRFDPISILLGGVTVRGVEVGSRAMFEEMNRAIMQSCITPMIDRRFLFDQLPEALQYLERGDHVGKVTIMI
jgi:NADPH:quinone reductase-like Zn-dependent oxidoreductase